MSQLQLLYPHIKGTSKTIARILQPYNIRVAHRPITTLRHLLANVKYKYEPNNRQGRVIRSNAPTSRPPTLDRLVGTRHSQRQTSDQKWRSS